MFYSKMQGEWETLSFKDGQFGLGRPYLAGPFHLNLKYGTEIMMI